MTEYGGLLQGVSNKETQVVRLIYWDRWRESQLVELGHMHLDGWIRLCNNSKVGCNETVGFLSPIGLS
jgi:hypothetical protein